jgi:hypothetical protein
MACSLTPKLKTLQARTRTPREMARVRELNLGTQRPQAVDAIAHRTSLSGHPDLIRRMISYEMALAALQ